MEVLSLNNVNLKLPAGKIIGLLGPNGSGKTTMIKIINGLLQPEYGQVLINGLTPLTRNKAIVSYLPDTTYLDEQMKVVKQHIFCRFYKDFDMERACTLLAELEIDLNSQIETSLKGTKKKFN